MNKLLILTILILFQCSCSTTEKRSGKIQSVILPQTDVSILGMAKNNFTSFDSFYKQTPTKIVSYINGDCSSCLQQLKEWNSFANETALNENIFIFIRNSYYTSNEFEAWLFSTNEYEFSIIFDSTNSYLNSNRLIESRCTFLIEDNNRIILDGNPLWDSKVRKAYLDILK